MPSIAIANSLADGFVVFRTTDGWSRDICSAAVVHDEDAASELLAAAEADAAANRVVAPYLIEVDISAGTPRPVEYREYIRAFGPSVPLPAGFPVIPGRAA
jgi:hypothetical protein